MTTLSEQTADNLAAMVRHLVRATEPDGEQDGLTPLQWSALQYVGLANGISRTVSGFAAYNATSKGTASQVIKSLVDKGLVRRVRSKQDARSAQLVITASGRRHLEEQHGNTLATAIQALSAADRARFGTVIAALMNELRPPHGRVQLGSCHDCRHLDAGGNAPICCRTGSRMEEPDLMTLCAAHAPMERGGQ